MCRAVVAALATALVSATTAAQEPRFDVASIRPHRATDDVMFALQFDEGGRFTATGTLRMLVRTAYRLQDSQVEGANGWMNEERFDVEARAGRDASPDAMRVMLRALLRERFALALRTASRDAPVYALRAAPGEPGPRRRLAAERCPAGACEVRLSPGVLSARGVTMAALAGELSWWVDRIVIDQTSLPQRFDVELEWAPDQMPQLPGALATSNPAAIARLDSSAPSIFTAVVEQLGLRLAPERGLVAVFVIDHAERPTAN